MFRKIYKNSVSEIEARVCGIWTKTALSLLPAREPLRGRGWRGLLQIAAAKNTGLPVHPAPSYRAFFPGGAGLQHFSFVLSQAAAAEAMSQVRAVERWGLLPPAKLRCGTEALPWTRHTENPGKTAIPWFLRQFYVKRSKPRGPPAMLCVHMHHHQALSSCSKNVNSKRNLLWSPASDPRLRQVTPNLLSFTAKCGEV